MSVPCGWEIRLGATARPNSPGWQQTSGRGLQDQGLILWQLEEKLGAMQFEPAQSRFRSPFLFIIRIYVET
jgi:hypothetical protein